jgi:carbonic anhydrase/acetyltransferase-like protein (isoleucine patch superfamily)
VVRGDCAKITIGRNTNIQDNVTLHVDDGTPLAIGDHVTVGHNAVVHGCTIGDDCIVGMASVVLSNAVVQRGSIVASGSVVTERSVIREFCMAAGAPAEVKRELGPEVLEKNREGAFKYSRLARAHRAALLAREKSSP